MPYKSVTWVLTEDQIAGLLKKLIDENEDGMLSKEELEKAFQELGSKIPSWRASRALCHADTNKDGRISLNEMKDLVAYVHKQKYKT